MSELLAPDHRLEVAELVTSGANAGTATTSPFTTGLGILPRTVQLSVAYGF